MNFKIAVLAGDGIGPEISVQGVDVMTAVCEKFGHQVSYKYALCGADANYLWSFVCSLDSLFFDLLSRIYFRRYDRIHYGGCRGNFVNQSSSGILYTIH